MKKSAYFAFALLGLIWGSNFIFMKWAAQEITPGQIVLLRVVYVTRCERCEPRYEPDHAATHALVHSLAEDASS